MRSSIGQLNLLVLPSTVPIIKGMVTWRYGSNCSIMGLNLPLNDEDELVITRLAMEYGFIIKPSNVSNVGNFISECEGLICPALRLIDTQPPGLLKGPCFTIPIPPLEPVSTILGLLIALPVMRIIGKEIIYEVYSDRWFRLKDLLLYLKLRGISINVYTTIAPEGNQVSPFDHVFQGKGKLNIRIPVEWSRGSEGDYIPLSIKELMGGSREIPLRALLDSGIPISEVNKLIMAGAAYLDVSDGVTVLRLSK
ncbi:hypothetical protein [Caldivirga maquilingensis]|uniref:Uncharacterized protein n=1 Tax=Caldivirga maquilingensis (strain ATCC 700844 / DSM 13496 / JCM 10307 / IC-167) TaxID=397948 RepID=A8M9S5_CALMQ|nr:hypothetical protein [Caldivirga maquilingensis]ABW02396.1 hypothetical protein Cmaq_1573 [Caldivirga maquilingensis IC-167]